MHTVTHEDAGIAQYYVHETGAGYSSPRGVKQCDRYDSAEGRPTHAHKLAGRGSQSSLVGKNRLLSDGSGKKPSLGVEGGWREHRLLFQVMRVPSGDTEKTDNPTVYTHQTGSHHRAQLPGKAESAAATRWAI